MSIVMIQKVQPYNSMSIVNNTMSINNNTKRIVNNTKSIAKMWIVTLSLELWLNCCVLLLSLLVSAPPNINKNDPINKKVYLKKI